MQAIPESRKADLIEIAITELGITRQRAEKMLVPELRERIRAAREPLEPEDPLSVKPPGLSRLSKVELQVECEQRGLPYTDKSTRGAMIVMITDDVEARQESVATPRNASPSEEPATTSPETDWYRMDVEEQEDPSTTRTGSSMVPPLPKAKVKAKGRGRH